MLGPIDGANIAERPKRAKPVGCLAGGSICSTAVKPSGIKAPPKKPWPARKTIMLPRLHACPHRIENRRNSAEVIIR